MTEELARSLLEELRGLRGDVQASGSHAELTLELLELNRRTVAALEQLVRQRPRGNTETLAYNKRRAERLLGIHRSLLSAHLKAGTLKTVPWGKGERIPKEEVDRVLRDGLPELPGQPEPSMPPGRRRAAGPRMRRPTEKQGTPGARIRALDV